MRIILIADSHLAASAPAFVANWNAAAAFAARSGAELTIHLGDITLDAINGVEQLEYARELIDRWPTPMRFLPGNHDIGDCPAGAGLPVDDALHPDWLAKYRALFGPDYWTLDCDAWRIIALDAELLGTGTKFEEEQWRWLTAQLAEKPGSPVALLLHKPLFDRDPNDPVPHSRYISLEPRLRLLDMFAAVDLRIVVSGHVHQYRDSVYNGVRHLWMPSSAFYIPDSAQLRIGEKVTGVGVIEFESDACHFNLVVPEGVQRHNILEYPLFPERANAP